jgi:hypothetical protein
MRFVEYDASYFYQSLFEQTHYLSAMYRTFQKVYLNRLYNLLEYYYTHSTSMIVFGIRPKGIRCLATLAIGIPRRDSPNGHSLRSNKSFQITNDMRNTQNHRPNRNHVKLINK